MERLARIRRTPLEIKDNKMMVASRKGFEPLTYGLGNRCSILLSYRDIIPILGAFLAPENPDRRFNGETDCFVIQEHSIGTSLFSLSTPQPEWPA